MLNWNTITQTQRNWDQTRPITQEQAETIAERVRSTLTKQNIPWYDVYYTINSKLIGDMHRVSKEISNDQGQLNAPMLVWFAHDEQYVRNHIKSVNTDNNLYIANDDIKDESTINRNVNFSYGLAVALTITAAVDLGYSAGATQCYDDDVMQQLLIDKSNGDFDTSINTITGVHGVKISGVIVGIGHARKDLPHNLPTDTSVSVPRLPNVKRVFHIGRKGT
jgi:hypothetical protein